MAAIPQASNDPTPNLMAMLGMGQGVPAQAPPPVMQQISQVLGMQGSQDAAMPLPTQIPNEPVMGTPLPSFAPTGPMDVQALQQAQQAQTAPEAPTAGSIFGGEMTESKKQRMMLFAAALMSPGNLADKFRLASLSQAAYSELQNSQMRATEQKGVEAERLRLDSENLRENRAASTEDTQQNTDTKRKTQKSVVAKAESDADKSSTDADLSILQLEEAELLKKANDKLDPTGAKRAQQTLDKVQAGIAHLKGQANRDNAAASHAQAQTTGENDKNTARKMLMPGSNATPEQREAALETLSGGRSAIKAKQDEHTLIKKLYKESNPGATDQEAATFALEHSSASKGQSAAMARTVLQTADPKSVEYKLALEMVNGEIKTAVEARRKRTPMGASNADGAGRTISEADITSNMAKYGKTRAEVIAQAKAKGFTVTEGK